MCKDPRTDQQIKTAITAEAQLARYIENSPTPTPQMRELAETLHQNMNNELDTLDCRRGR